MSILYIHKAGTPQVNGIYVQLSPTSFRKEFSNIGLVLHSDRNWYISDCGPDFTSSGTDHLDFYSASESSLSDPSVLNWEVAEDGQDPLPQLSVLKTPSALLSVLKELNTVSPEVLRLICRSSTACQDSQVSQTLSALYACSVVRLEDLCRLVQVSELAEHFFPLYLSLCQELRRRLDPSVHSVEQILAVVDRERCFRSLDGLATATAVKTVYRAIERLGNIPERDRILGRAKLFSVADFLRSVVTGGRLDSEGRDATFQKFWTEDGAKDQDPEKERKCPVIKNALESGKVVAECEEKRRSLLSGVERTLTLDELGKYHCNNEKLRLISIHGVVWDVTCNLDKYASDGEYFFFPGKDITYPMGISSLSDKYANTFVKMNPEMLIRVYGWMDYFAAKYHVYGRLLEWDAEDQFQLAQVVQGEGDCCVM